MVIPQNDGVINESGFRLLQASCEGNHAHFMIGVGRAVSRRGRCQRVVEEVPDIVIHRPLIALEREGVVAALVDDLLGDCPLAIERVNGDDGPLERQ